jgi:hypothetical protein
VKLRFMKKFFIFKQQHCFCSAVQLVGKDIVHRSVIENLLIGVEGAKTPAGAAGGHGKSPAF